MKRLLSVNEFLLTIRKQRVNMIACVNKENALGNGGELLYRIKEDFAWFQQVTIGHVVIMGVKTYKEIGRPLPNRRNIVVYQPEKGKPDVHEEVILVQKLEEALMIASFDGERDVFIIGGMKLFQEAYLNGVDYIYRTQVWDDAKGDAFFIEEDRIQSDFHTWNNEPFTPISSLNRVTSKEVSLHFEVWRSNRLLERADELANWISATTLKA